jgi:hypothetical protein
LLKERTPRCKFYEPFMCVTVHNRRRSNSRAQSDLQLLECLLRVVTFSQQSCCSHRRSCLTGNKDDNNADDSRTGIRPRSSAMTIPWPRCPVESRSTVIAAYPPISKVETLPVIPPPPATATLLLSQSTSLHICHLPFGSL